MAKEQHLCCFADRVGHVREPPEYDRFVLMALFRYNPNTQLFHTYTTLFENRLAGGIPSETFRSINLERFSNNAGTVAITAGVEVSLFAFILFYIVIEARNIHRLGFKAWVTDGYSLLMYESPRFRCF